jgi:hypothetical protein
VILSIRRSDDCLSSPCLRSYDKIIRLIWFALDQRAAGKGRNSYRPKALGKEGKVRSLSHTQMRQLVEAYIGHPRNLPPIDFDSQSQFIEEFMKAGAPEFRIAFIQ